MAAFLVVSLCIPEAFDDRGLLFAGAYAVVRYAQLALFWIGSEDDPELRKSVSGLAVSSTIGVGLLVVAAFTDGWLQGALWALALFLDMGGPYLFGSEGWKLRPGHFAERHALIIIIALGESIVAIGVGSEVGVDAGVVTAAVLGTGVAAALWWMYFDIVALVAERRLQNAEPGQGAERDRPRLVLLPALPDGRRHRARRARAEEDARPRRRPAQARAGDAMLAGTALYLVAHVAFRWRNVHRFSSHTARSSRSVLVALIPLALEIPSLAMLADPASRS